MINWMRIIDISIKNIVASTMLLCFVFSTTDVLAASATYGSPHLKITGKLPECTYPQKRGGGNCLNNMNANSCIDTAPFKKVGKAAYGVSSEMCARGQTWCNANKGLNTKRCPISASNPPKNHQGYDYSAECGTPIYAPCDGKITVGRLNGLRFVCETCGKKIEYTFYHNQKASPAGVYKRGQKIGEAGNLKGYPCHMHIEIRENNVLLDPMNSGFDSYVCSCMPNKQVNRMNCFTGGNVPPMPVDAVYDDELSSAFDSQMSAAEGSDTGFTTEKGCTFSEVMADYLSAGCMFCDPFRILFNTVSVMAKAVYNTFAPAMVVLLVIGFAIWLALVIMRFVSHFERQEPRTVVKLMINQAFKVLVIVLLLQGPLEELLSITLNPVFSTGLKIAQLGGGIAGGENPAGCNITDGSVADNSQSPSAGFDIVQGTLNTVAPSEAIRGVISSDAGGLSPEMGNGILCTIKNIQDQVIDVLAIARVAHCLGWKDRTLYIIPNFGYLITAVAFFTLAFMMLMSYPFLLIDSMLKMAVAVALLPAALVAYAFKPTAGYLKKVFGTFIDAVLTFIFLSVVILIITSIVKQYVTEILTDDVRNGLLGPVIWFTIGALKIMFVLFLGWAVLSQIKTFAKTFSGGIGGGVGGGMNIGSPIGAAFNAVVKNRVAKPIGVASWEATKFGTNAAKENLSHGLRKARSLGFGESIAAAQDENGEPMLDEDGNQMYEATGLGVAKAWNSFVGKARNENSTSALGNFVNKSAEKMMVNRKYKSYSTASNGNVVETKTKINSDGSRNVVRQDDFGSVTTTYDENGNIIKQNFSYSKVMNNLISRSGKLNTAMVESFMQNSLLSEKDKQAMVVNMLIKTRMRQYVGGKMSDRFVTRNVTGGVNENNDKFIEVKQKNIDGTITTFRATFRGDRVMTDVVTMGRNNRGIAYCTDGIIQRKSQINGNKVTHLYSVASEYSDKTQRPLFMNGDFALNINRKDIMFDEKDIDLFVQQVKDKGNKAYTFTEFA